MKPHSITFIENVIVSLSIPNYGEVKEKHPNAQLEIWHADKYSDDQNKLNWKLVEYSPSRDKEAIVLTEHFWIEAPWTSIESWFCAPPFDIKERCQVFMSSETRLQPSQDTTFSIAVLFYPCKEEPEPLPCNYRYMLLDSGLLDLRVSKGDALQFKIEPSFTKNAQVNIWTTHNFWPSTEIIHC